MAHSIARQTGLLVVLAGYVGVTGFFLSVFYKDLLVSVAAAASSAGYSYLLVIYGSVASILVLSIVEQRLGLASSVTLGRILASLFLVSSAVLLYSLAGFAGMYEVQVRAFSAILLAWGLMAVFLRVLDASGLAAIASLILLVPVPTAALDELSVHLSRLVGSTVSALSGAELILTPSATYLRVATPSGPRLLEITFACSGVVSVSALLAIAPVALYIGLSSRGSAARKAAAIASSLLAGVAVVIGGNILRVYAVVEAAKASGVEEAMRLFHSTPSILYVAVGVAGALGVALKLAGRSAPPPSPGGGGSARSMLVALFAVFLAAFTLYYYIGPPLSPGGIYSASFTELVKDPSAVISGEAEILSKRVDPGLALRLGETVTQQIVVEYRGERYTGFIELAESPLRFHSWSVCLAYQGYQLLGQERVSAGGQPVEIYYVDLSGSEGVVAYTVYKVLASFGGVEKPVYIKLSLIYRAPPGEKVGLDTIRNMLDLFKAVAEKTGQETLRSLSKSITAAHITTVTALAAALYVTATLAYKKRVEKRAPSI